MSDLPPNLIPLPLRSALKTDDDGDKASRSPPASAALKAVQIADPVPESYIEDDSSHHANNNNNNNNNNNKHRRPALARRLSGRMTPNQLLLGVSSRTSASNSPAMRPVDDPSHHHHHHHHSRRIYQSEKLLAQVGEWLERERNKAASKKLKSRRRRKSASPPAAGTTRERSASIDSQSSDVSLDGLQHILEASMASMGLAPQPSHSSPRFGPKHRRSSRTSLHRAASSDTDYVDGDAIVPSCDAWLDNSKTLSYSGGSAGVDDDLSAQSAKADKEREAWLVFKNEILRIAHTLRLRGWRRVPLGTGDAIAVERLSGALTNAVYVVTPPTGIPQLEGKKPPQKVLLRIYGPQVEHLIDRENELQVLQRLARKKIGPRLLGTFKNGRFEQFFNAITLTPLNLREPDTSRQIAKRMRELHEGVEVMPHERENGPGVWKNWDQWLDNVSRITTFLDRQLEESGHADRPSSVIHAWKANGHVCGMPWEQFKAMVAKYRAHLNSFYKDKKPIKDKLVFAHNDTQYGNILRIRPDDEKSPLLQPANKHKQLVVIDFEYAAANTAGLEFANHFTEWTYNYHDPLTSYACHADRYPTVDEQRRFIRAYLDHRPQFPLASGPASAAATPLLLPTSASASSIVDFMLDARYPGGDWSAAERAREEQTELKVRELMDETRLWRAANSAQWVAWGIVQAKVPGLEGGAEKKEEQEEEDGEFDYLSYAQDRAMFFWGDCVNMGLVKLDELPESLQARLKIVEV